MIARAAWRIAFALALVALVLFAVRVAVRYLILTLKGV